MNISILIADDHRVFIEGMRALMKEFSGFEVTGDAENGEDLVRQVETLQPDIVLTDIQMPVMDGVEATREIHKRFPATKIIALTMVNESLYIRKMLEAGASGYVLKTISKDELLLALTKVAAGEKYFSPEVTAQLVNHFSDKTVSAGSPADLLTKREKEILTLIAQGLTDKEIAEKVCLSPFTITTHRKNMLSKLGLKNKVELTRFAMENNLLS